MSQNFDKAISTFYHDTYSKKTQRYCLPQPSYRTSAGLMADHALMLQQVQHERREFSISAESSECSPLVLNKRSALKGSTCASNPRNSV